MTKSVRYREVVENHSNKQIFVQTSFSEILIQRNLSNLRVQSTLRVPLSLYIKIQTEMDGASVRQADLCFYNTSFGAFRSVSISASLLLHSLAKPASQADHSSMVQIWLMMLSALPWRRCYYVLSQVSFNNSKRWGVLWISPSRSSKRWFATHCKRQGHKVTALAEEPGDQESI